MAFDQFDYEKVALFGDKEIKALMKNENIIRNKQKIKAAVNNAQCFIKIRKKHRTFSQYIWDFVGGKPLQNSFKTLDEIPSKTTLSSTISKDLKRNGFKFVGPTVIYAYMQATGMVNDHLVGCFRYQELTQKIRRRSSSVPSVGSSAGSNAGGGGMGGISELDDTPTASILHPWMELKYLVSPEG